MKICPNQILLVVSANTDIPSKVHMPAEGLNFSYFKNLSNGTTKINIYASDSYGIYESEEKLIIISGLFKDSIEDYADKHIDEILASFDHQGLMILIDKKTLDTYIVQSPVIYQPIFYTLQNGVVLVSNDMNSIVKILKDAYGVKPSMDLLALYELILLDEVVSTHTIVKEVKHVRAGEYIHITAKESLELKHARYWEPWKIVKSFTSPNANKSNLQTLIQTLIETISEYCEVDESTIGVPLSGGLDSTMILALLLKACKNKKVIPFHLNIGSIYELYLTRQVCESSNVHCVYARYHITEILSNYDNLLYRHLCHISFPRPGDASLPYSLLAENLNRLKVKFVISGDAGDRVWGHYDIPAYVLRVLFEKNLSEFIRLVKTLLIYDRSILVKLIFETLHYFMKIKFPRRHFMRRIRKTLGSANITLAQYVSALYENTLEPRSTNYFKESLSRGYVFLSSILVNTNVKAHEYHDITLTSLFASRKLLETILSIPDELFYVPYGDRSLQRLILKVLGYPPYIYMQKTVLMLPIISSPILK